MKANFGSSRKTARIVGVLFIIATLAPLVSGVFLLPMAKTNDLLAYVVANGNHVVYSVLLELVMIMAIVSIAVVIFPVLKKHNEALALGYLGSRIVEVIPFMLGVMSLTLLPVLSQQGAADASLQNLGNLLLSVNDWSYVIAGQIIFGFTALILNSALYQARLVPRWLSSLGLLGVPLMLTAGFLELFGINMTSLFSSLLVLPLALQEMIFALWLITKGFNSSAITSEPTKTGRVFA
jgi:hypothetical protein